MKKRRSILSRAVAGTLAGVLLLSVQLPMNLKGEDALPTGGELSTEALEDSTEWEVFSTEEVGLPVEETETSMQEIEVPLEELQVRAEIEVTDMPKESEAEMLTQDTEESVQGAEAPTEELQILAEIKDLPDETENITGGESELSEETVGYDVTAPVIESVEFLENGQELSAGDTLHLTVKAYDAESGIREVSVSIESFYYGTVSFELPETDEKNEYTAEYGISVLMQGSYSMTVSVIDMRGNVSEKSDYRFSVMDSEISVKNISIDRQGETLKPGDVVKIEAEILPEKYMSNGVIGAFYAGFYGNNNSRSVLLTYNSEKNKLEGSFKVGEADEAGRHTLSSSIQLYSEGVWRTFDYSAENIPYFFVDGVEDTAENDDESEIELESISLGDADGKFVNPGDTVFVSVKLKGNAENLSQFGRLYFEPQVDDIKTTYSTMVNLVYNKDTETYEGNYVLPDDIYPCEWSVSSVYVGSWYTEFQGIMSEVKYFNVKNQDTFVQKNYDIVLSVWAMNDDRGFSSYDSTIYYKEIKDVQRRTTLREILGEDASVLEKIGDVNGHKFLGWGRCWNADDYFGLDDEIVIPGSGSLTLYPQYESYNLEVALRYMDNEGKYITEYIVYLYNIGETKRKTLREILGENASVLDKAGDVDGHKFLGWEYEGDVVGLDDEVKISDYLNWDIYLKAKYDSYNAAVSLIYVNAKGQQEWETIYVPYKKGATYGEIIEQIASGIEERESYSGLKFSGWKNVDSWYNLNLVPDGELLLDYNAEYSGKTPIFAYEKNSNATRAELIMIANEENLDADTIVDLCCGLDAPEPEEGRTFIRWDVTRVDFNSNPPYGRLTYPHVSMRPRYRECIAEVFFEMESKEILCVQPGEQFMLPAECVMGDGENKYGLKNIEWYNGDTGEFIDASKLITATESMLIYGYGEYVDYADMNISDDENQNDSTSNGSQLDTDKPDGSSGDKPDSAKAELSSATVETVIKQIKEAQGQNSSGKVIKVDMKDATVVPKEILEAAKGSNVSIVLDMGYYSWTINGKDIIAGDLKSINLEVKMDTNAVPSRIVDVISDGNPTRQLSLTYNGDFGFKASLSVNVGAQNSGQYGNLYHYDSNNKLVFQNAGQISADGTVRLDFSHASNYVIVIGKSMQPSSQNQQSGSGNTAPSSGAESGTVLKSPLTGDRMPELALSVFGVCAILLICCIYKTKESANKNA